MRDIDSIHVWWLLRAWRRRNPLVRTSDRIELFIAALAILTVMVATAFAGALGTAVHDVRSHRYLTEARTRHTMIARATENSTTVMGFRGHAVTIVDARWQVNGTDHTDALTIDGPAKTGDPLQIWVDGDGNHVDAPTPTSRAGWDAVGVAYAAWQAVLFTVAGLLWWGRARLDRRRISGWERDIRSLVYGGGSGNRKT
jgi:hypothetical protein